MKNPKSLPKGNNLALKVIHFFFISKNDPKVCRNQLKVSNNKGYPSNFQARAKLKMRSRFWLYQKNKICKAFHLIMVIKLIAKSQNLSNIIRLNNLKWRKIKINNNINLNSNSCTRNLPIIKIWTNRWVRTIKKYNINNLNPLLGIRI